MRRVLGLIGVVTTFSLVSSECFAQSHSPYAGFETRAIKALSDQQIADLRSGLGIELGSGRRAQWLSRASSYRRACQGAGFEC